ncbi:MAG TPA: sugar ABC transporter permease [Firmicutes bacterium]|nr:sugar ABC transporter permease [Bacillota bacterium]
MTYIEYVQLSPKEKIKYKFTSFFKNLGHGFINFFVNLYFRLIRFFKGLGRSFKEVGYAFKHGNVFTKLSFLFLGVGHMASGQIIKGILILLVEALFIFYMIMTGGAAIYGFTTLGNLESYFQCLHGVPDASGNVNFVLDSNDYHFLDQSTAGEMCELLHPGESIQLTQIRCDNSFTFLLFGLLAIVIIVAFVLFYISTIKNTILLQERKQAKLHVSTFFEDIKDYLDGKFHRVLLALPILGVCVFTILPIIDMILMAFTNYNRTTSYPRFFSWIGIDNFITLFGGGMSKSGAKFGLTFVKILGWTMIWAVLATFLNYFLGMFVAMLINKKGIKFKKVFRTVLVFSIAMPQFISLLAFNKFFAKGGMIESLLKLLGLMSQNDALRILDQATSARIFIIIVNIWVGIPYTMLAVTGILMNVPEDLYESAQIDGASPFTVYTKITLPYVIFITGPKLITDFVGNINNFNVIYFLTGGNPATNDYLNAGKTDLLVTWLYKLTVNQMNYSYASVIGIMIFVICAVLSLIAYRHTSAVKNEEDFA